MDDDEDVLQAVRSVRAARGAALAELVRVIRAHKEVFLHDGALRVECVRGERRRVCRVLGGRGRAVRHSERVPGAPTAAPGQGLA
jgi:hypothetical protein